MPRGGKREGAGRKPGALSTKTRKVAEAAATEGITPLEVMIENMRFAHESAEGFLRKLIESETPIEGFDAYKEMLRLRAMSQECAKDAAPYMHPRLAAIEHTGASGGPIEIVSKRQRDAAVLAASRADS